MDLEAKQIVNFKCRRPASGSSLHQRAWENLHDSRESTPEANDGHIPILFGLDWAGGSSKPNIRGGASWPCG